MLPHGIPELQPETGGYDTEPAEVFSEGSMRLFQNSQVGSADDDHLNRLKKTETRRANVLSEPGTHRSIVSDKT